MNNYCVGWYNSLERDMDELSLYNYENVDRYWCIVANNKNEAILKFLNHEFEYEKKYSEESYANMKKDAAELLVMNAGN